MKCLQTNTEERIKEAAKKVFLEKGFDGTTTREIAKEAGLNSALMNYYFRSKEKLFALVFEELLRLFFQGMLDIINKPGILKEKIFELIDHDFRMFKQNTSLSIFILNELHRDPDRFLKAIPLKQIIDHSFFEQQVNEAVRQGEIRDINPQHILLLLVSNVQFIFQCKAIHMHIWDMTDAQFDQFAENHKVIVQEMVTSFLFETQVAN